MTLRFHAQLTADGKQAAGEIRKTAAAADQLSGELKGVTRDGAGTSRTLDQIENEARATARSLTSTAGEAQRVGQTHTLAAGSVGNLTAQFNDLGVMMAAGQNPLQLALQQGTQITQVIGPMGAAGAVRSLGTAFMSLLSPINIVTLGSIAAGAAMVQWLTSSSAEAEHVEDVLERLSGRVDEIRTRSSQSAQEIAKEFGSVSPAVARMLSELRTGGFDEIERDSERAAQSLIQSIGQQALSVAQAARRAGDRAGYDAIKDAGLELDNAAGLDERIRALEAVKRAVAAVASENENVVAAQDAVTVSVAETEAVLRQAATARETVAQGIKELWTSVSDGARDYVATMLTEFRAAQSIVDNLEQEVELRRIAAAHGADSAAYVQAQADVTRAALAAQLDAADATEAQRDAAMAAADEMERFSLAALNADLSGLSDQAAALARFMGFSADEAERYNAALNQSAGLKDVTPQNGLSFGLEGSAGDGLGVGFTPLGFGNLDDPPRPRRGPDYSTPAPSRSGRAAREERDAVADLIERYQEQLDVLRETDPVQQEMIRHREALADATEEERARVGALIGAIEQEEQAKARAQEQTDFLRDSTSDLIPSLVRGGDEAADAWDRLARSIEDAAWQALLFNEGPFSIGGSGGGLFGFVGSLLGFDEGGMVHGRGGPREDRELVRVSPGEYIVNAEATSRNRALLEAINSGSAIRGFADGGMAGGGGAGGMMVLQTQIIDQSSRGLDIREESEPMQGGGRLQRYVISEAVNEAISSPGTEAYRTLARRGVPPTRPRR